MTTRDNNQRDRPSMTRVIGYEFESPQDLERVTDDLLEREIERAGTPLTQFGTNGKILWLNGSPGPALREVVAKVEALGWKRRAKGTLP